MQIGPWRLNQSWNIKKFEETFRCNYSHWKNFMIPLSKCPIFSVYFRSTAYGVFSDEHQLLLLFFFFKLKKLVERLD